MIYLQLSFAIQTKIDTNNYDNVGVVRTMQFKSMPSQGDVVWSNAHKMAYNFDIVANCMAPYNNH